MISGVFREAEGQLPPIRFLEKPKCNTKSFLEAKLSLSKKSLHMILETVIVKMFPLRTKLRLLISKDRLIITFSLPNALAFSKKVCFEIQQWS